MKKIIAVILMMAVVMSLGACGKEGSKEEAEKKTVDAGAMVLTETGTIPEGVSFMSGQILYKSGEKGTQILDQNGVAFNDCWYEGVDSYIRNGVCVVYNVDTDGKKLLGVVDSVNRKELVACEAVDIEWLSDRFLLVGYMTGLGTQEDRFGVYSGESGMVDYKGYGKVLDLDKGQFVPGIEVTTSYLDAAAAGNMIFVDVDYPATNVYTADGNLVGSYDYIVPYPQSSLTMQYTRDGVCIYDQDMKLVSTLTQVNGEEYETIAGSSQMLLREFASRYCVTDLQGNPLTKEYPRILSVYPAGYLRISENEKIRTVDFAGNTIVEGSASYEEPGYFIENIEGGINIYDLSGKKLNKNRLTSKDGLVLKNGYHKALVIETGEIFDAVGSARGLTGSLALIENKVYDMVTGKVVLENVDGCMVTGNMLYVWNEESKTYTGYAAEFKSKG